MNHVQCITQGIPPMPDCQQEKNEKNDFDLLYDVGKDKSFSYSNSSWQNGVFIIFIAEMFR